MVDYTYYVMIGAILMALGLIGFITRRNLILMFLCTELMFQGVIVTLVGFNRHHLLAGNSGLEGQVFTVFLLVIAAAEAALAMALVMVLQRHKQTLDAARFAELRG